MKLERALSSLRPGEKWIIPGEPFLNNVIWENPDVIRPTQAEVDAEIKRLDANEAAQKDYALASSTLHKRLDEIAVKWGYRSFESALGWKGDKNPKYAAEAQALADYGSDCFLVCDKIQNGEIPTPPTMNHFLALLPMIPTRPEA